MEKRINHKIGEVFGTYTIIDIIYVNGKKKYKIKCKCGEEVSRIGYELRKNKKCGRCRINGILGKKIGKVTFLEHIEKELFKILCECGKTYINRLRSKSCGCHLKENVMKKAKNLVGKKFNDLKVIKYIGIDKDGDSIYQIKCKCGKLFEATTKFKLLKSCGCRINANYSKGENHYYSKYSQEDMAQLKDLYLTKCYSNKELSKIFNINIGHLKEIIAGKSWKHLNFPIHNKKNDCSEISEGQVFKHWTVLKKVESKYKQARFLCKCICGNESIVLASSLRKGKSTKCYDCNAKNFASRNYLKKES